MRISMLLFAVLFMVGVSLSVAAVKAADKSDEVSVTGTLATGVMAIGGETTGTELTTDAKERYELDLQGNKELAKKAEGLNGKQVTVKGTLMAKKGVERGTRKNMSVTALEAKEEKAKQ